ncbi:PREDICTED: telomere repeat-binding protein 5 isoform X3 [Tarenaya hassleriana]|uniref:telomere repeat-binding protein 5 isoform X3 n=1 Tax=Tarenaya hassleriana TaxID=28532 RepID=UPI00053C0B84|nr:PREDICTED: telomere repeat-binding protein 5 isoform X3 [Tarenaya hassleriana]
MVLQKRLDYGLNGYQRSAFKKKGADHQISPFDLLAAVAGNFLREGGNSSSSSNNASGNGDQCPATQSHVKKETLDEDQTAREETCVHDDAQRRFFVSEILPKAHQIQSLSPLKDSHLGSTSVITSSDSSERVGSRELVFGSKNQTASPDGDCGKSEHNDKDSTVGSLIKEVKLVEDMVPMNEHPHIGRTPTYGNSILQNPLPVEPDGVDLVNRGNDDDDENSARAYVSDTTKSFRSTLHVGDRRIRKILASKCCTVSPKPKGTTGTNSSLDLKPGYSSSLRSERNYPIKKRRYFDCFNPSQSEEETVKKEGHCGSPHKDITRNNGKNTSSAILSSTTDQKTKLQSRDSQAKLRIKSFRVPELFIEIPETSTVGSLKRTVLEAVNAILGGGLRIGVLVQGKKLRDDNRTLLQTGIPLDALSDSLGFCLEPNPSQSPKPLCPGDSNPPLPCNIPQPLTRYLPSPGSRNVLAKRNNSVESDRDYKPSASRAMTGKTTSEYSRALVPVPPFQAEAITVIPPRKPKRCEVAQRRIRRPFSVAEVEALVQAVEKLGTGRWRDVKLRAFDNAKHRTYVDLKDKWKTLVHTARISPQQRRGEPVPQELLDRVLTAHAYWSQQQGKHQQLTQSHGPETSLGL